MTAAALSPSSSASSLGTSSPASASGAAAASSQAVAAQPPPALALPAQEKQVYQCYKCESPAAALVYSECISNGFLARALSWMGESFEMPAARLQCSCGTNS